jgi:hypothetical protein
MDIIKLATITMITVTEKSMTDKMWYLQLPKKIRSSRMISGFVALELVDIITTLLRTCSLSMRSKRASRFITAKV